MTEPADTTLGLGQNPYYDGYVNVKRYGALGNGINDDSVAIQKAITTAVNLGFSSVFVPTGTFIIGTTITIPSNFELFGDGSGLTVLKLKNNVNVGVITNSDHINGNTNITVRDLCIDGNGANQVAYSGPATNKIGLELFQTLNCRVIDIEVKNCAGYGLWANGNAILDGPGFFSGIYSHDNQAIGTYIGNGLRRCVVTQCISERNGLTGFFFGASQMVATNIYAFENGSRTGAQSSNIYIFNVTGCNFTNMTAACGYTSGIEVQGLRHSVGSGWSAYQNGQAANNTYDDITFLANTAGASYGETANLSISGIFCGHDEQLNTSFQTGKARYALYVDDPVHSNIRLDGVVYGDSETSPVRVPDILDTLYINGVLQTGLAYTPTTPATPVFWHDTSNSGSVTLNVSDVSQINDLSGNVRHASQGTAGQQPAYTTAGINGKNVITYTGGNNDALAFASALGVARNVAGFTFMGIAKFADFAAQYRLLTILNNGAGPRFALNVNATSAKLSLSSRRLDADSVVTSTSTTCIFTAGVASFFAVSLNYSTGQVSFYLDGITETLAVTWAGGNGNTSDTDSGSAPNYGRNGAVVFSGVQGEWLAYAQTLTATQINLLRMNYFRPNWANAA